MITLKRLLILFSCLYLAGCGSPSKPGGLEKERPQENSDLEVEAYGKTSDKSTEPVEPVKVFNEKTVKSKLDQALKRKDIVDIKRISAQLLSRDENNIQALNALGAANFISKKYGIARIFWNRVIQKDSKNSMALNNLGVLSLIDGEDTDAIDFFKKAIKANSDNSQALANLGSLYLRYYNFKAAEASFSLARSDFRSNRAFINNYALSLYGTGDKRRSMAMLSDLVKANPKNVDLSINYASVLVYSGTDLKRAEKILTQIKLLTRDPRELLRVSKIEGKLSATIQEKISNEKRSKK